MVNTDDIRWLAGWLEGEGCFYWRIGIVRDHPGRRTGGCVSITAGSTDEDVLKRAALLLGAKALGPRTYAYHPKRKTFWTFQLAGAAAVGWMMTLYSLMGLRRKAQIKKALVQWKHLDPTKASLTVLRRRFSP